MRYLPVIGWALYHVVLAVGLMALGYSPFGVWVGVSLAFAWTVRRR